MHNSYVTASSGEEEEVIRIDKMSESREMKVHYVHKLEIISFLF